MRYLLVLTLFAHIASGREIIDDRASSRYLEFVSQDVNLLLRETEAIHRLGYHIDPRVFQALPESSWPGQLHRRLLTDDPIRANRMGRPLYDTEYLMRQQIYMLGQHIQGLRTLMSGRAENFRLRIHFTRGTHAFLNSMAGVRFYLGSLRETYLVDQRIRTLEYSRKLDLVARMNRVKRLANRIFEAIYQANRAPLVGALTPPASVHAECGPIRTSIADPRNLAYETFPFYEFPRENEAGIPTPEPDYLNYLTGHVIPPELTEPAPVPDPEDPESWNRRWNGGPSDHPDTRQHPSSRHGGIGQPTTRFSPRR